VRDHFSKSPNPRDHGMTIPTTKLKVGDLVDHNGQWTEVKSIEAHDPASVAGRLQSDYASTCQWQVLLTSGDEILCRDESEWTVAPVRESRTYTFRDGRTLTIKRNLPSVCFDGHGPRWDKASHTEEWTQPTDGGEFWMHRRYLTTKQAAALFRLCWAKDPRYRAPSHYTMRERLVRLGLAIEGPGGFVPTRLGEMAAEAMAHGIGYAARALASDTASAIDLIQIPDTLRAAISVETDHVGMMTVGFARLLSPRSERELRWQMDDDPEANEHVRHMFQQRKSVDEIRRFAAERRAERDRVATEEEGPDDE